MSESECPPCDLFALVCEKVRHQLNDPRKCDEVVRDLREGRIDPDKLKDRLYSTFTPQEIELMRKVAKTLVKR
jgi:hypothetical protein